MIGTQEIVDALLRAGKPDREVDCMIGARFGFENDGGDHIFGFKSAFARFPERAVEAASERSGYYYTILPWYTAKIDDMVSLIQRELPGWVWSCGTCHVSDDGWLVPGWNDPAHGERFRRELPEPVPRSKWDEGFDGSLAPGRGHVAFVLCHTFLIAIKAIEEHKARTALSPTDGGRDG
jgi:hypothetical protein